MKEIKRSSRISSREGYPVGKEKEKAEEEDEEEKKKIEEKETNLSNEIWNCERNGANAIQV